MKKAILIATALVCASLLAVGSAAAQSRQIMFTSQSPAPVKPAVRTPVAGYSPNLAAPQPATREILATDANRLIRWQGWLDVDAFSVSVLNQMQKRLGRGIEVGAYTIEEPGIAEAVMKASAADPTFVMCPILKEGDAVQFEGTPTLYVWTYRHNFADRGLHQLYISAKGKMFIGHGTRGYRGEEPVEHKDIQSIYYEFGNLGPGVTERTVRRPVIVDVEIWRGAVVFVDHTGTLRIAGTENVLDLPVGSVPGGLVPLDMHTPVAAAPMSDWERAPSLICNPNYDPRRATGAAFVEPLERTRTIRENSVQLRAGDVQKRVRTVTPFQFRAAPPRW
ncbi:MAG: hypothetical protein FWG73_02000 [Planctomycetaceae bacterium]|nr:hypothetical protein [Planctomycetaceae bacterium]